ncbi:protein ABSCISIC ACID-INSENSITIVE 5 [Senna tora]|uniref:Protein ABSCISIC ACID-INSENSITIVE 5 n=1 Tax=Senna tora TaxID=362788 RepID=A0A834TCA1_9FABA|nr:protein ABSCISIC ACID-INSENSITIVE 5 [Senna tora]
MVGGEGDEMNSQMGEVESAFQTTDQSSKSNQILSNLGRQSSIYSLTLDEFQHTLCEGGKNFGSMNMDEFLTSIWSAEENQANIVSNNNNVNNNNVCLNEASADKIRKQPSLNRQGSLTLTIPPPLSRKTVDQVWSEIHRQHHHTTHSHNNNNHLNDDAATANLHNSNSAPRQPTFGEMTLEDFLVKAGVVRESFTAPPAHSQYGMYTNNKSTMGPTFVGRPVVGNVVPPYQAAQGGEASGKRDVIAGSGYPPPAAPGVCYGGRVVNGGGGYGATPTMGIGGPVSPVSSDGLGASENSGGQYGMEMGVLRGRKRIIDGPVEKVVERRQRRMIKNRESAARSRARKQAYTVELEAELNQLREENAQLKHALCFEEMNNNMRFQTKAQKAKEKLRALRRNLSCPL